MLSESLSVSSLPNGGLNKNGDYFFVSNIGRNIVMWVCDVKRSASLCLDVPPLLSGILC